ncbi:hypothetical protein Acr_06g0007220 [Actinidia rufa]|uniref:Reverse transcriptase domain-containing protein n=1 Tax=Actinidia rufa TaxID=165716 RepID=A0A7J0ER21_9ERIC|nr:hypothetical protein Acr_06g0007220 [Actinidia rufa]
MCKKFGKNIGMQGVISQIWGYKQVPTRDRRGEWSSFKKGNGRGQNQQRDGRPSNARKQIEQSRSRAQEWRKKGIQTTQKENKQSSTLWIKKQLPIKVKELGNGWLYRSAIAKLSSARSVVRIQDQLRSLGHAHVMVRHMGGDMVVLTFKDTEERDTMFNEGRMAWLTEWFEELHKWEDTKSNPCSLGKVLISTTTMDPINKVVELENNGSLTQIRVMEEQLVVNTALRTECAYPGCQVKTVEALETSTLHKSLVLIKLDDRDWGPKPFKFFNVWLSNPNCVKLMEEAWESNTDQGWAAFRIHKKLKSMKASLKVWAQKEFRGIHSKLEEVERDLHELDIKFEQGAIFVSEKSKRKELKVEMWKLNRLVDRIWWQKSSLKWQLQGDKNSKFFHYMVSSRQRRNNINTILVNEEQIEDPKLIKKATFNHFKSLYEEEMVTRPFFIENQGNSISEELAGQLVGAFTENEVWCCIKSCDGNKATGPDGFNMQRIKKGWGFMKKDILDFMGEFHNNCIRQGDPMSPYLFIIAAEGLNWLLKNAELLGSFSGLKMRIDGPMVTHLQFTDDTLIFCQPNLAEVVSIKNVLRRFEHISGLKIKYQKSVMSGVGMEATEMQPLAEALNCQIQMLPIKYLGLPLGANPKLKSTWKPVVDKIKFRLSSWKSPLGVGLYLSRFSIFKMPEGVIKRIDSIQSRFLWGGSNLKRKIHLVAWSKLHQSKICGGLGIRDIKLLNEALLLKWWWRFGMDKSSLWRKVYIRQLAMFKAFIENAKLRVGDGSTIKFWKDIWLGNLPLLSQYTTLYRITINKSEFLSDVYIRFEETQRWDFLFRRPLLVREVEALDDLNELMVISGVEINLDRHDQLIWQGCPS